MISLDLYIQGKWDANGSMTEKLITRHTLKHILFFVTFPLLDKPQIYFTISIKNLLVRRQSEKSRLIFKRVQASSLKFNQIKK